ncbi:MAG: type II toxin-antitoxin system VapC family toxin [Cyanobacteria bacterium K_Offshore_0m_m2_072]|nr:type II toxin-antitoxin system VapC family toxin [Cyanobacteria bacterium K_Offshore_0m_m2_072]
MKFLLDANILIDVLRGEQAARAWLEQQQRPAISVITWIEVLVGCRAQEAPVVEAWLEGFDRLSMDQAVAALTVTLSQRHGLKVPDAIILATAQHHGLQLVTRNVRDFPLTLGSVLHPYCL